MPTYIIILIAIIIIFLIAYCLLNIERETLNEQSRAEASGKFIKLKHGNVHYEVGGKAENPLVVLVHGFSTPSYIWGPTFQALVQAGFKVLRFDLYGRGFSDRPKVNYDLDLFVEQLDELLQKLKLDKPFHLVGLSMGGPIAASYTNQHSSTVHSLTLIDPLVSNIFKSKFFPLNIKVVGELAMVLYIAPFVLARSQCGDFVHSEKYPDWPEKYKVQMQYKGFRRAILSTIRHIAKADTLYEYQLVGEKGIPTLIFYGKEDQTIPAEDITTLRKLIPGHKFHAIDNAAHIPHYEQAQVVNPILIDYFKA